MRLNCFIESYRAVWNWKPAEDTTCLVAANYGSKPSKYLQNGALFYCIVVVLIFANVRLLTSLSVNTACSGISKQSIDGSGWIIVALWKTHSVAWVAVNAMLQNVTVVTVNAPTLPLWEALVAQKARCRLEIGNFGAGSRAFKANIAITGLRAQVFNTNKVKLPFLVREQT